MELISGMSRIAFSLVSLSTVAAMELTPPGARSGVATSAFTEQRADWDFLFLLNKKHTHQREGVLFGGSVLRGEIFPVNGGVIP